MESLNYISEDKEFNHKSFDELVSNCIDIRLRSDVPIAAFCSGGLDSTLIIKKLKDLKNEVPTFSVINRNPKYDERVYISQVSNKYKTNNTVKEIDREVSFEDLLKNIENFDEPYMDASNQPSSYISQKYLKSIKLLFLEMEEMKYSFGF